MAEVLRRHQLVAVPAGGSSIFELRLEEPDDYPFVRHVFADATKGAIEGFRAEVVSK